MTQDEPERVVIQTNSLAETVLVLSDAYYPGWQATVDGAATAVYPTNAYFRGLLLPAGEHEVVFTFAPKSLANGRWLSLFGLGIAIGIFVVLGLGQLKITSTKSAKAD
jgi:uncharacterized membrane protein YfhO